MLTAHKFIRSLTVKGCAYCDSQGLRNIGPDDPIHIKTALFTFDGSTDCDEMQAHSGQVVTVGGCVWTAKGEPMTDAEAGEERAEMGDVLREITAADGWQYYAWESELALLR